METDADYRYRLRDYVIKVTGSPVLNELQRIDTAGGDALDRIGSSYGCHRRELPKRDAFGEAVRQAQVRAEEVPSGYVPERPESFDKDLIWRATMGED